MNGTRNQLREKNGVEIDSLSAHISRQTVDWSRAVEAVFTLANFLGIRYPKEGEISLEHQVFEILLKISSNLTENWVKLLNREAFLIPYALH